MKDTDIGVRGGGIMVQRAIKGPRVRIVGDHGRAIGTRARRNQKVRAAVGGRKERGERRGAER